MKQQLSIKEIEKNLALKAEISDEELHNLKQDERKGVQHLIKRWERRRQQRLQQLDRFTEMSKFENHLYQQGYHYIAGVDEAGRGPLAGPVVAGAVVLPKDCKLIGLNDSKQLSESKRHDLYYKISEVAIAVGVGIVSPEDIDRMNIYQASKYAMELAINQLKTNPDYLLIDAMKVSHSIPQQSLIKGDARSISIAAGSIIAKVTRDNIMREYDHQYPEYGFAQHMGYPTKIHIEALERYGPCPIHRQSFSPVNTLK